MRNIVLLTNNLIEEILLKKVRIFPGDRIFVNPLNYKKEKVLLVGETGAQRAIPINLISVHHYLTQFFQVVF